jgi:hypothetical protein
MAEPTHGPPAAIIEERDGVVFWRVLWFGPIDLTKEFVTFEESGGYMGLYSDETFQSRIAPRSHEKWTLAEMVDLPTVVSPDDDVAARVVAALGVAGARELIGVLERSDAELLGVLERSDAERAALIGRLYARENARWLAELLMDMEDEVGAIARLRLFEALRRKVGSA